jgi:hypothetical protein
MLPMAGHIIALDSLGTILAQGDFKQVQAHLPNSAVVRRPLKEASTFRTHEASQAKLDGHKNQPEMGGEFRVATPTGGAAALKYYFGLASWSAWAGFYGSLSIVVCMNTLMSEFSDIYQSNER